MEDLKHVSLLRSLVSIIVSYPALKLVYCMIIAAIPARIGGAREQLDMRNAVSVKSKGTLCLGFR